MTKVDDRDPHTTADQALAAVAGAGPAASKLVSLWEQHDNAAALLEVARHGQGHIKKEARKALRALKARGVTPPKHVATLKPAAAKATEQAFLLPPDPGFNTLLVLARRTETTRYRAAFVYLGMDPSVQRVDVASLSQSGLKEALDQALRRTGSRAVQVPIDWARQRIARALKEQRERGTPEPLKLRSARELLEPAPEAPTAHPFDAEGFTLSLEDSREMTHSSRELHSFPEFRGWLPPRAAVDELLREVGKTLTPDEQPGDEALQERLRQATDAATDRFFTPELRTMIGEAMKDSALSVLQRAGEQPALRVAAAINCIESAGLITDPPSTVPFLRAFFEKALAVMHAQNDGQLRIPVSAPAAGAQQEPAEQVPDDSPH